MSRYFNPRIRRRLAPVVLVLGLVVSGRLAYDAVPRSQPLRLVFGEAQRTSVQSLRVTYVQDDEALAGLERHFPEGAPRELVLSPSLSPGEYDLAVELRDAGGRIQTLRRPILVTGEGAVEIVLEAAR
jgi:hypothetical protein